MDRGVDAAQHGGAVSVLLHAYANGGFAATYPMARAASVMLVLPLAAAMAGEWPRPLGPLGVALDSAGVLLLTRGERAPPRKAVLWTLAASAFGAVHSVCDALGVRAGSSALAYGCAMAIANALVGTAWQRRRGLRLAELRALWLPALPMALAATLSYWLILRVYARAPIAPAAALRDSSAIFATLIALTVLRERPDRRVVWAVALATARAVAIRLG